MAKKIKETFSHRVKEEAAGSVTGRKRSDACLIALMLFADVCADSIEFKTDSQTCCDLFVRLASHASENENAVEIDVLRSRGRAPMHVVRISGRNDIDRIEKRLGVKSLDTGELVKRAEGLGEKYFGSFMAGVFLACGSISSPDKEYHLELVLPSAELCGRISDMLYLRMKIRMKAAERHSLHILYIKGSEGIEDILTLIGAPMSSLELMNVKVLKDIRNRANRATNCDTANCERQNRSAARQIEAIRVIERSEGGLSLLSDELREIAAMRLKYPEYTLAELSRELDPPISKSGANHRFEKIEKIAEELAGGLKKG